MVVKWDFDVILVIDAQGPVATALFLGDPALFNTTREDCVWKRGNDRDQCPDSDITMTLFPPKNLDGRSKVEIILLPIWINTCLVHYLTQNDWVKEKKSVHLISLFAWFMSEEKKTKSLHAMNLYVLSYLRNNV